MRVCVYCGSSDGDRAIYRETAARVGRALATRGVGVVYGGGVVGCMGALADGALAAGGEVVGIIPDRLAGREVAHRGLTVLRVVASMHERKAAMTELADAFLALPGGFGTLDELFETLTWRTLGYHAKPCAILDVAGFFSPLLRFCDDARDAGFVGAATRAALISGDDLETVLSELLTRAARSSP